MALKHLVFRGNNNHFKEIVQALKYKTPQFNNTECVDLTQTNLRFFNSPEGKCK